MRLGCIERKEKGKTGSVGGPKRATAHFGSVVSIEKILPRQSSSSLGSRQGLSCRDKVLRPSARPGLGSHDRHARAAGMHVR